MKAVKANKEYTIAEQEQKRYIADGYDIVDDKGNIIAYGRGKIVPYEKYKKVLDELNALKAEKAEIVDLTAMTVEELIAYAKDNNIDIGQASTQEGILKKIKASREA
uniref:HeH/LEM domain n=1 Tax=Siphoviridae sp. ctrap8 TaxID=2827955 RepID=A0A8S5SQE1_9CAUD|nr:MAG TPA: HeH/LEM domain [Siphoviridae sp. ctrap8]